MVKWMQISLPPFPLLQIKEPKAAYERNELTLYDFPVPISHHQTTT